MSSNRSINFQIITPVKTIFKENVKSIKVATVDGDHSFLYGHEDFVATLRDTPISITTFDSKFEYAVIDAIFQLKKNSATILARFAAPPNEIDSVLSSHSKMLSDRYELELKADEDIQRIEFALRQSLMHQNKGGYQ